jgi:hypothetical protein
VKRLYAISLFFVLILCSRAQTSSNAWVSYSQKYFKFPVYREGIYRLDSATLSNYFDLSTINPKNFQLFFKGKEQNIFIRGENDNKFNKNDYIDFYGNPNTREIDSLIYIDTIKYVPSPYLPLFSDTVYAFLTLNASISNKRYTYESDTNSVAYNAANYFYTENIFTSKNTYNSIWEFPDGATDPHYTQPEGYGYYFTKGQSAVTNFSNLNPYTAAPLTCYLRMSYAGASLNMYPADHEAEISYTDQSMNPVILSDTLFAGFPHMLRTFTLSSQNLSNNSNVTITSVANPSFATFDNGTILNYIYLKHAQTLNLAGKNSYRIFFDNSGTSKGFYNFSNFGFGATDSVLLYDVTNGRRIRTVRAGGQLRAVIPNSAGPQGFCFLASEADTIRVRKLRPVGQNGSFTNFKDPSATNPYAIIYNSALTSGAMQYQSYRQSPQGGSYNMIMAEMNELTDQFGYGAYKHPVAIRSFMKFLMDSLPVQPKYLLMIGKGVNPTDIGGAAEQAYNLVPTMGVPGNDNLLTSQLSSSLANAYSPEIPIGRLAAESNSEVTEYLAKLQVHENSAPAEWKKRVLHFVGGNDPTLTTVLASYLSNDSTIIADTLFGGNVLTFKKNTTAPIQVTISDSIKAAISHGCALLTFFGHGSEQGFDQAIDNPDDFDNKDKYPFVVANSCYSGNIHIPGRRSVSENFVFANQKGSVGFLAATSTGFVYALKNYTDWLYTALGKTKYNQGVGDIVKEAALNNSNNGDAIIRFTSLDMTLHGDPAMKITNGLLPDYQIANSDVSFKLSTSTFETKVKILNLGAAKSASMIVRIYRYFPNGDSVIVDTNKTGTLFRDSLKFTMPIDFVRGIGLNKFKVKVDFLNQIPESNEMNNSTIGTVDLFIPGGDILPVYPYKYAIVEKTPTITLKASTSDPFAPSTRYWFQLDTCDRFTAPIQSTLITSSGGVVEWNINLPFGDSTVYFWRVSKDSISPNSPFVWKESSFQTIGNKRGWGQAHFHQFKNDAYQFVAYKKDLRQFIFENSKYSIACRNGLYPYIWPTNISYFFNSITMSNWGCARNGWNIAVFDDISAQPQMFYKNDVPGSEPGQYNNCQCEDYALSYASFGKGDPSTCQFPAWKQDLESFLNQIPPNKYVLAFTMGIESDSNATISTYHESLYKAFDSIGAVSIRNTPDTVAYILFGRKGMLAGQGHEVKGAKKTDIIYLSDSIQTKWDNGFVASEMIGPSYKWNSLHWRVASLDLGRGDRTVLKVLGYKANGHMDTLATFPIDSTDVLDLGSYVDATMYPYMKLVALMSDKRYVTSPQLKRWQVLYDEAPECALNPLKGFASINDTLMEGDVVTFRFPIENVGVKDFRDSLVVTYWVEDDSRNKVMLPQKSKPKPFVPGQVIIDTVKVNSYQLSGSNGLWIFVNPLGNSKYQNEQYQFNNIGRYSFKVNKDVTNPLLDVTFDGIRILNGDIVSARPNILITLKDENKFLQLNDTGAFTVSLLTPDQGMKKVFFANDLLFTPASLPKNSCAINYNPALSTDGKYSLIVQAKDRSNNRSGLQSYQVDFTVDNKPTVTNVLNYPNPFSTSTKFVFTLTGSEVPEVFTIQIMTITGKVVREITRAELGHIHIGRNITDYSWDGRDAFGDRLGNGVYLYRVITKLNGESIEKSATGADKFFTKEFGKMVIMR